MGTKPPPEDLEPHQVLEQHLPNVSAITQLAMKRAIEAHARLKLLYDNLMEERTKDLLEKERFRGMAAIVDAINRLTDAVRMPPMSIVLPPEGGGGGSYEIPSRFTRSSTEPPPQPPEPSEPGVPAATAAAPELEESHAEGTNGSSRSVR